jgi:hypothetical protein
MIMDSKVAYTAEDFLYLQINYSLPFRLSRRENHNLSKVLESSCLQCEYLSNDEYARYEMGS